MGVYEELQARGLIAQVTNEEEIKKMVNEERRYSISASTRRRTVSMWDILWRSA